MKKTILNLFFGLLSATVATAAEKPNIVLVMTDDQGYGDLACHGNPYVKTPNIDQLSSESVNLQDFHVFPTCSPTRAALMTGHWANRTGVWHTINGRSLLRKNEVTLASMLNKAGYETGIFGKWHLGDSYPFRPEDKGFSYTFYHGAGGVGQTPDAWNNDYFTGHYRHNGKLTKVDGFCTDVFFDESHKFIKQCVEEKKPFFAYIASNAPHLPLLAPQEYLDQYKDQPDDLAAFYGMITNIDDNVGETRKFLKELGIYENTIFIYMTDNGSAHGSEAYNAGMQGKKDSPYDGGHRVPFMLHYPAKGMTSKREIKTLTHVVDLAPTLLELCGVEKDSSVEFDGVSITSLLEGKTDGWKNRYVITDSQRVVDPIKWRKSSVMIQDWRLVNGEELYNIVEDPAQQNNLAKKHPEKLELLRSYYDEWWNELEPTYAETAEFILGSDKAKVVTLNGHDWIQKNLPPWNQSHIRGLKKFVTKDFEGFWAVEVETPGKYNLACFRWDPQAKAPITSSLPAQPDRPGVGKPYCAYPGQALDIKEVVIEVDGKEIGRKPVTTKDVSVSLEAELAKGKQKISAYFILADGKQVGVPYCTFTK
ncbi:arylsulfatase [Rubritalea spongiae]|uniref:Arylsulfatase n=1 Tax=Rubritalea spongiae TaxID=430797 RepID=A0ABW5E559_9BACT